MKHSMGVQSLATKLALDEEQKIAHEVLQPFIDV